MTDHKSAHVVSGFSMNLTTNSALLNTDRRVGCPQLTLTFTNRVNGSRKLFVDRNEQGDAIPKFPNVDIHLVARVGAYSLKFEEYLNIDIRHDPDIAVADEAQRAADANVKEFERTCREHFKGVKGIKELDDKIDAQEKRVQRFRKNNRRGNLDGDIREADEALQGLYRERTKLKAENPVPVDAQQLPALKRAKEWADGNVDATEQKLRSPRNRKHVLKQYLGQKRLKLSKLPEILVDAIAEGAVDFFEVEHDASPTETDRRGIPYARLGNVSIDGEKLVYSERMSICDRELAIPWEHVLTALKPANLNKLYRAGGKERFFVYAQLDTSMPLSDEVGSVDTIVIGAFPKGRQDVGWVLNLRKKQWVEVIRNIDHVRSSGIIEQKLPYWPHESHATIATDTSSTEDSDEREEDPDPSDTEGSEPQEDSPPQALERSEGSKDEGSEAPSEASEEQAPGAASPMN